MHVTYPQVLDPFRVTQGRNLSALDPQKVYGRCMLVKFTVNLDLRANNNFAKFPR